MKFDAFISYRHGELDGLVVEKLHKILETYRVPAAIAKKTGKKRISRIFRDREELPTSSNLSGSINDALENSEFLLLICSPRLLESKWCMREVEIFGRIHGKDKIITLLIDGEPDDAFPPDIRFREINGQTVEVEPLAADIRAATWKESLKLLKNEKLRLLAPLLNCGYDDLKQRHRARRRKITAAIVGSVLAGSLAFGSFSTYQYLQIQRQMQLKLENQSYVLAGYSDEALSEGDPETAALLAMEALPKSLDKPERPYVKAASLALANSLGVYDMSDGFKPYKTLTLPAAPGGLTLSPGESYAAVNYAFELIIFDTKTAKAVAVLPTVESVLAGAEFLDDHIIVFAGEDGLTAYDISEGSILWKNEKATGVTVSGDRSHVAALYRDENKALLYTADGQAAGEISFGDRRCPVPHDDTFLNPRDFVFALNDDGSKLAVSFAEGSLSIFDTNGSRKEINLYPPSGAVHFDGGFSGDFFSFALVEKEPYIAKYMVYDLQRGTGTLELTSQNSKFVTCSGGEGLYFANENQIYEVNGASGEMNHIASVGDRIECLRKSGSAFLVCDAGGYHFIGEGVKSYASDYVCDFAAIGDSFALTGSYDSETIRILKNQSSPAAPLFAYDTSYDFSEARLVGEAELVVFYSYRGFSRFTLDGTPLGQVAFPNPEGIIDTQFDKTGGNLAVLYKDGLRLYSCRDGSLLLEKFGAKDKKSVTFTPYGVHIMEDGGLVSTVDLTSATVTREERVPPEADFAVLAAKPLYGYDGLVFYDGNQIGDGTFIGGASYDGGYAFAIGGNEGGKVFTVPAGQVGLKERFAFNVRGKSEAFFTGNFVFIAELRGTATAYSMDGAVVRRFSEDGYLAETEPLGDGILAHFVSASKGRYSLLLDGKTLEARAYFPGLHDSRGDNTLIFDDGNGFLRAGRVYDDRELMDAAREILDGRELTQDQRLKYHTD